MKFIKQSGVFNSEKNYLDNAPIFFKKFSIQDIENCYINICSPNLAICYVNGKNITKDLYCSPFSVYEKTIWVNRYKISSLLNKGENIIQVLVGNGLRNEGISSVWELDKEDYRDFPKFALEVFQNNKLIVESDNSWKFSLNSIVTYNQFRVGEYIDYRNKVDFESENNFVVVDTNPPKGQLRFCNFEMVRECEHFLPKDVIKISENKFLIDFGKNISGYVKISGVFKKDKQIVVSYGEKINEDNTFNQGNMPAHYKNCEFQVDKIIGDGKYHCYKPLFTYHGFRYVIIEGISDLSKYRIKSCFIHQNLKQQFKLKSNDSNLNTLLNMAINSLYSNMIHYITDCPTREKFAWFNDAMCSCEVILYLFNSKRFCLKFLQDCVDSVKDNGDVPCLLPNCKWAYSNCHAVFMASCMFEYADKIYQIYGDKSGYEISFDALKRYIFFALKDRQKDGLFIQPYGLGEWVGPYDDYFNPPAPLKFTDSVLMYKCLGIITNASKVLNKKDDFKYFLSLKEQLKRAIIKNYIDDNGRCVINEQSTLALLIYFDLYNDLTPLKIQFMRTIEEKKFHHYCGMIGLRYLYSALSKIGLSEYAYKIITASGYPSYLDWIRDGETSLCETWKNIGSSHNHHVFSSFVLWIISDLCGLSLKKNRVVFKNINVNLVDNIKFTFRNKEYNN